MDIKDGIVYILLAVLCYGLTSFMAWSFNPGGWDTIVRIFMVLAWFIMCGTYFHNKME